MKRLLTSIILIIGVFGAGLASAKSIHKRLKTEMRAQLVSAINESGAKIQVKSWKVSQPKVLARSVQLESLNLTNKRRPYGNVTFVAYLVDKNGQSQKVFVFANVDAKVPVWVVRRRIGRGAPLNDLNVSVERRSLARLSTNVLRATNPLAGRLAARALPAGSVLTRSSITTSRLVHRGESVTVSVRIGNVVVKSKGQALSEGRLNDRVRVRLAMANRVVSGVVDGRGRVVVQP